MAEEKKYRTTQVHADKLQLLNISELTLEQAEEALALCEFVMATDFIKHWKSEDFARFNKNINQLTEHIKNKRKV